MRLSVGSRCPKAGSPVMLGNLVILALFFCMSVSTIAVQTTEAMQEQPSCLTFGNETSPDLCTCSTKCFGSGCNQTSLTFNTTACQDCYCGLNCSEAQFYKASDHMCQDIATCKPGTYIITNATNTSDRMCLSCEEGTFSGTRNSKACTTWTKCDQPYQRQRRAGNTVHDVQCECQPGAYAGTFNASTRPPLLVCKPCPAGTFTSSGNTAPVCNAASPCAPGYREAVPPTPTSDRALVACRQNVTFKAAAACTATCAALTTCDETAEYESGPPSLSHDRRCAPLSACSTGTFEVRPPTPTSDRACEAISLVDVATVSISFAVDFDAVSSALLEEQLSTTLRSEPFSVVGYLNLRILPGSLVVHLDMTDDASVQRVTLLTDRGALALLVNGELVTAQRIPSAATPDTSSTSSPDTLTTTQLLIVVGAAFGVVLLVIATVLIIVCRTSGDAKPARQQQQPQQQQSQQDHSQKQERQDHSQQQQPQQQRRQRLQQQHVSAVQCEDPLQHQDKGHLRNHNKHHPQRRQMQQQQQPLELRMGGRGDKLDMGLVESLQAGLCAAYPTPGIPPLHNQHPAGKPSQRGLMEENVTRSNPLYTQRLEETEEATTAGEGDGFSTAAEDDESVHGVDVTRWANTTADASFLWNRHKKDRNNNTSIKSSRYDECTSRGGGRKHKNMKRRRKGHRSQGSHEGFEADKGDDMSHSSNATDVHDTSEGSFHLNQRSQTPVKERVKRSLLAFGESVTSNTRARGNHEACSEQLQLQETGERRQQAPACCHLCYDPPHQPAPPLPAHHNKQACEGAPSRSQAGGPELLSQQLPTAQQSDAKQEWGSGYAGDAHALQEQLRQAQLKLEQQSLQVQRTQHQRHQLEMDQHHSHHQHKQHLRVDERQTRGKPQALQSPRQQRAYAYHTPEKAMVAVNSSAKSGQAPDSGYVHTPSSCTSARHRQRSKHRQRRPLDGSAPAQELAFLTHDMSFSEDDLLHDVSIMAVRGTPAEILQTRSATGTPNLQPLPRSSSSSSNTENNRGSDKGRSHLPASKSGRSLVLATPDPAQIWESSFIADKRPPVRMPSQSSISAAGVSDSEAGPWGYDSDAVMSA